MHIIAPVRWGIFRDVTITNNFKKRLEIRVLRNSSGKTLRAHYVNGPLFKSIIVSIAIATYKKSIDLFKCVCYIGFEIILYVYEEVDAVTFV